MLYRDQRGSLRKSMETQQEINSIEELKAHFESNDVFKRKIADIKFEYVGFDSRISQETYYVSAKFEKEDQFYMMGMSDSEIK